MSRRSGCRFADKDMCQCVAGGGCLAAFARPGNTFDMVDLNRNVSGFAAVMTPAETAAIDAGLRSYMLRVGALEELTERWQKALPARMEFVAQSL